MDNFNQTLNLKKSLIIIVSLLILAITFETFQQIYYIKKYNIYENPSFFYILKQQSYRWIIWMALGSILVYYSKKQGFQKAYNLSYFLKYFLFILGLVALNIIIISLLQLALNNVDITITTFLKQYLPFYTFQKAPIYILGYSTIAIILHFYFLNEQLQIQVYNLTELKDVNLNLYNELKSEINNEATFLNIKVGNKRKIIPVEDIIWIEADDYCVRIHLEKNKTYSMRSSLKSLINKLPNHFLRVHRKSIVNMKTVAELNSSQSPFLKLHNEIEIPISKSNYTVVKKYIS